MASIWFARELDPIDATPANGAKRLLDEWLENDDQGNLKVRDEQQEGIVNLTREWLRESRSMRRRGRELEDFAGQLTDSKLLWCRKVKCRVEQSCCFCQLAAAKIAWYCLSLLISKK